MNLERAAAIRTTPGLTREIQSRRDELITRFNAIIRLASVEKNDRNAAANLQMQMQVETSLLISAAEGLQELIRALQEMWLFGPLNTIGDSDAQQQTDDNARVVADLLDKLAAKQDGGKSGVNEKNGETNSATDLSSPMESATL